MSKLLTAFVFAVAVTFGLGGGATLSQACDKTAEAENAQSPIQLAADETKDETKEDGSDDGDTAEGGESSGY